MTVVQYNPPDKTALAATSESALRMVRAFTVENDGDYAMGADELTAIKGKLAMLEEQRTTITGPLNQAVKAVNDLFRGPRDVLEQAERIIKSKLLDYRKQVEARAAAERARAEAAARAERERLEQQAEEQRRLAAAAVTAEARAQAEASAAEAETHAQLVTAAPPASVVPKVQGVSVAHGRDVEVADKLAFVRAIAEGAGSAPELLDLLDVNMAKLRAQLRAKGQHFAMDGCKVVETSTVRSR